MDAHDQLTALRLDRAVGRLSPTEIAQIERDNPTLPPATLWALDDLQAAELHVAHASGVPTPEQTTPVALCFPGWTGLPRQVHPDALRAGGAGDRGAGPGGGPDRRAKRDGRGGGVSGGGGGGPGGPKGGGRACGKRRPAPLAGNPDHGAGFALGGRLRQGG